MLSGKRVHHDERDDRKVSRLLGAALRRQAVIGARCWRHVGELNAIVHGASPKEKVSGQVASGRPPPVVVALWPAGVPPTGVSSVSLGDLQ